MKIALKLWSRVGRYFRKNKICTKVEEYKVYNDMLSPQGICDYGHSSPQDEYFFYGILTF